ncbi:hypothetical protein [Heyndrickxia ginsengihumi]|uniref:Uncharacterized protein n=1 Tax=Heyndrickxia ginsengihumi TaxID=363870 RepID=A0A6M0P5E9_9BACI|nr:hypothetical protein [Heyndrickxia ginsengihumi]MBE6185171.1 hypothetical protein [Bacillus sp. (in: firmicutes)]MCM3023814.1 hypothetical protein [Heyndrickxia ginsengihumi]NEY19926.1 hypothetical protein [Heyndrickxia ginsengihumi]
MNINVAQIKETWVNDYLDLYLFAKNIGDIKWQQEILEILKSADQEIEKEKEVILHKELWDEYDQINEQLLSIYEQLKTNPYRTELQDRLWELKLKRVELNRQIQEREHSKQILTKNNDIKANEY